MVEIDVIVIGHIIKLIEKRENHEKESIDWGHVLDIYGFEYLLDKYDITRSQYYGDEAYPWHIRKIIKEAYETDEEATILMINNIFNEYLELNEDDFEKYTWLEGFLNNGAAKPFIPIKTNYLDIETVPNDFYKDLIDLINKSYSYEIYEAVSIFSRKLLENLIIEILRNEYGTKDIEKYFIVNEKKFKPFRRLLENLNEILDDLKHIEPSLNKTFVKEISNFKSTGDRSAHSIVLNINRKDIDEKKESLNHLVKTLIKIILSQMNSK